MHVKDRLSGLRVLVRKILIEGGAYGHLSHLYEALDLTFGELLDILRAASEGHLENVTEKTDGINMFFTVVDGELRIATNSGFIRTGGMDREQVVARFADKPQVQKAYVGGYDAMKNAISNLSTKDVENFFGGKDGRVWYSVEVITSGLSMTIDYRKNILAVHLNGSKVVRPDGTEEAGDHESAAALGSRLEVSNVSNDWEVRGPAMVQLPSMSKEAYRRAEARIRSLGVDASDTIQDYLAKNAEQALAANGAKSPALESAAKKMAGFPGQPNLTTFKKQVPPTAYALMQNSKEWAKDAILPLEDIVTDFAVERLKGVDSALMDNSQAEVQRLRGMVEKAIAAIEASGDETALSVLQREMIKLKSVENIVTPMEGIVFHYKGRILKLTGAFSSFHKILALFTFGKNGTKLSMGESRLHEGGHALSDMQPIPLENFNAEFPSIVSMLKSIGAEKVVPVGSTGKKSLMGDIDLAVETPMSIEQFQKSLENKVGAENVKRNVTVVSFAHDFDGIVGQIDLMFGNTNYLSWARVGTDPSKTPFKGIARNLLMNILARTLSEKVFQDQSDALNKKRYIVDMDRGLFINTQTKAGKNGKELSDWKTVNREFVTDDPDEIVAVLLGEEFASKDIVTFESMIDAIKNSKRTRSIYGSVVKQFVAELRTAATKKPDLLGPDTMNLIDKVEQEYL